MIKILGLLLIALWLFGVLVLKTVGAIIHLVLLLAVVLLLVGMVRRRSRRP